MGWQLEGLYPTGSISDILVLRGATVGHRHRLIGGTTRDDFDIPPI